MVRLFAICLALVFALPLSAQTAEDDSEKGRIETWLEETLSAAGRDVRISGFSGAFSSEARFDELSIADDDGVWLTIESATLNWSRSALLSGRVDINELAADKITILRQPLPGPAISAEDSQSTVFEVPDLPVSLEIDKIDVASIQIAPPVLGQDIELSIAGTAQLVDGQMAVDIEARRQADLGTFGLIANFANETRLLDIALTLEEAEGGIVASLLNIPGAPELELSLLGAAPLTDFTAELSLKTNQTEQVSGEIRYREAMQDTPEALRFGANLSGDLRPLFASDFHPFFGERSEIAIEASQSLEGAVEVETLTLETGVLAMNGSLELAADKLPNRFDLKGSITSDQPVRLPSSGAQITLGGMTLAARFDASQSDAWSAELMLSDLNHDALVVPTARLSGAGTIDRSFGKRVTGDITFDAQAVSFTDPGLAEAANGDLSGQVVLDWAEGATLRVRSLSLNNEGMMLVANGTVGAVANGLPVTGRADARVSDVERFSALLGRPLNGAAEVNIQGQYDILGGSFDGIADAKTTNLAIGEARLDPLLLGEAAVSLSAVRTPEGTTLRDFSLATPTSQINALGRIDPNRGELTLEAALSELALVEPKLAGEGRVETRLTWNEDTGFQLSDLTADIASAQLTGDVAYAPSSKELSGNVNLIGPDLSVFSKLANMDLSGGVDLKAEGTAVLSEQNYSLNAEFKGDNLQVGIAQLDPLIAGSVMGILSGQMDGENLSLEALRLTSPLVSIEAGSNGTPNFVSYQASLKDVAPIAPGFSGPFSLSGSATLDAPNASKVDIVAAAEGPAGLTLRASGSVVDFGQTVDLDVTGSAPLGLANGFIAPNSAQGTLRYDLGVRGPPQLSAVSGQIAISDTRLALPDSGIVLDQVGGTVSLASARASLDIRGTSNAGGSVTVSGPVSLTSGNAADLAISLQNFGLADPDLFETSLSGQIKVVGPLAGAARISGGIQLGTTEIMVPSGNAGSGGDIPDIQHVGAPRDVAVTLNRAGINPSNTGSPTRALPLDLVVTAPNQIFVRGRGLDAELGGRLELGGTTAEVSPSGSFELVRGRFEILGRRFVMNEGLINLRGNLDPFLRFVADTDTSAGVVSVILEGLASAPELRFDSEAGLPQEEAIAQLLFGRGLENISALQAASLVSAVATLSGRSSGGVTSRLRTALGLSDFDVTTTDSGARQLRAGAYINENIYSEITVDSDGNQAIDLNLNITPNLRAKGGTNSSGNTGIGIFFEKDY